MKIVIATPFYPPQTGVLATYAAGLEAAFQRLGHHVSVVSRNNSLPGVLSHLEYLCRIWLRLTGADIVFSLDMWSVGVPAAAAARMRGVPLYVRVGGDFLWEQYIERTGEQVRLSEFYDVERPLSRRERFIERRMRQVLRQASHVFFNTDFQKRIWEKAYSLEAGKTSRVENYFPPSIATSAPSNRTFVSANRKARYKNGGTLEGAFSALKKARPDIELDTRTLPHREQLERLATCYAVVIPAVSEVGSNIAIEAVVRGRPFIMSEDTGSTERLGGCGLFVDTRSEDALKGAIESLLDPAVYERYASKCRAFSYVHSWDDIAGEILQTL